MKYKKLLIQLSLLMAIVLMIAGCSSNTQEVGNKEESKEKTYTFKVATATPEADSDSQFIYKAFMDKVTALTNGRVQFEWYPAQQLGSLPDYINLTASKVTDIGMFAVSVFPSEMPLGNTVTGIPGIYQSASSGSIAYTNLARQSPMLESDFTRHGVYPLVATVTPTYNIYTKGKKIKTPADLKGLKIRASGGVHSEAMKFAGAIPIAIPSPDMYEAYDKGAVDALHGFASSDSFGGYRELSDWGSRNLHFAGGTTGLMINLELWQSLPEDIKLVFKQAGDEVAKEGPQKYEEDTIAREKRWIESGDVPLYEPNKSEKAEWQKFYDEFTQYLLKEKNSEDFNKELKMFKEEVEKAEKSK